MEKVAANLQRVRNGQRRYAITPRIPGGFVQPAMLQKFIDVSKAFGAVLKITGSQRIMITNLKAEDVDKAWDMLGMEPVYPQSNRVRSVKICPGTTFCKRAKQDSVHLGMQLEKKYISQEMPSKMKLGVSGCPNSCSESALKDIGVIGTPNGWDIYAGGSGGAHPRIGDYIVSVTTEQEVLDIIDRIITFYKENAHIERMGQFIERIGLDAFKEAVLGESVVPEETQQPEPIVNLPGEGSKALKDERQLQPGEPITENTIIRDIVDTYPNLVPVLQDIGMGCLGCPSATSEPLWQAAEIHGYNVYDIIQRLEDARKGA